MFNKSLSLLALAIAIVALFASFSQTQVLAGVPINAQFPWGKNVTVQLRSEYQGPGSAYSGALMSQNENWVVVRDDRGTTTWCQISNVATIRYDSPQAEQESSK